MTMAQDPKNTVPTPMPEPRSQVDAQVRAMLDKRSSKRAVFVGPDAQGPSPEVLASAGVPVFQLPFSGASGGARGTLYTTDRDIYLDAAKRVSSKQGVTDKDLDRYLYGRNQGKPAGQTVVVQGRDDKGKVVVSRATDPKDVDSVAKELKRQVPSGQATVASVESELQERGSGIDLERGAIAIEMEQEGSYLAYAQQFIGQTPAEDLDYMQYVRNMLGENVFEPQKPPAGQVYMGVGKSGAPIYGTPGTLSGAAVAGEGFQGTTELDKWMAAGEKFTSDMYGSMESFIDAPRRLVVDYYLNNDVPFADWDDRLRAEVDRVSAATGIDRNTLQLAIWEDVKKATDQWLGVDAAFNLGKRMQQRFSRRPKEVQDTIRANIAGGIGSFVPTLPAAFISGGAGFAVGTGMYATQGGYEAYSQAREQGADFEEALGGGAIGAIPAAASAMSARLLVTQRMFGRWNRASGGRVEKMMDTITKNVVGRLAVAGAVEGGSELLDELFIKAGVAYATDQDLLDLEGLADDLMKSGEVGAETGIAIRAVVEGIFKLRARGAKGLSPTVNDKPILDEETGEPIPITPTAIGIPAAESMGRGAAVPFGPVQRENVVERYVKQAMLQPELLPRETPLNEMAAIIAAEENLDIGVATLVARNVRERLDQGARDPNRPPQLSEYTKVDIRDPKTWPVGVQEAVVQQQYDEAVQSFVRDYKAYEARQAETRAQGAALRQAEGRRAVTQEEVSSLRESIVRKYAEKDAAPKDIGDAQREYLREIYIEQLIEANKPDLLAGNPTESEYQRRVRELIREDNRRPEMRDTPEAQQDAEFWKQKLLESYQQREAADAAELAQLEADYQIELDQIAAELQARQEQFLVGVQELTAAESPERKAQAKELEGYLKLRQRDAVRQQRSIQAIIKRRKEDEERFKRQQEEGQAKFAPEAETSERKAKVKELRDYLSVLETEAARQQKSIEAIVDQRQRAEERLRVAQQEAQARFTPEAERSERKAEIQRLKEYLQLLETEAIRSQKSIDAIVEQRKQAEAQRKAAEEEGQAKFGPAAETPERKAELEKIREYYRILENDYLRLSKGYAAVAESRRITVEQAEAAQKELAELFTGGMETEARRAKLDEMKADFKKKYGDIEPAPARTEEQEAAYAEFEAQLPALVQDLDDAKAEAAQLRNDVEVLNFSIETIEREIETQVQAKNTAEVKRLQESRRQAGNLLKETEGKVLQAEARVRAARDAIQQDPNYGAEVRSSEVAPERSVTPTASAVTVAPQYAPRVATFFSGTGTVEAMLGKVSHVLAVENEDAIVDAYNAAHGTSFKPASVFDVDIEQVKAVNPDLFHASPVCKEFSLGKLGNQAPDQDEVRSAQQIAKVIREVQPPAVTIENVPAYQQFPPFQDILAALRDSGYKHRILTVDAADYGGAQKRNRMIVQAVRTGELPPLPEKTGPADWYELTKDLLATAEVSPLGPDELARIQSMVKAGKLDATKPIITMGTSAIKGVASAANAGGPAPTLMASEKQVVRVLFPDGKSVRVPMRALARIQGLPDAFTIPARPAIAKKVLGNGVHGVITEKFIRPLLPKAKLQDAQPVAPVTAQGTDKPVAAAKNKYTLTDQQAGVMLARAMPEVYGGANQQRQNGLRRVLQAVSEPGTQNVTIDDVLNVVAAKKGESIQDRRLRVQDYLATLTDGGLIQPVDGGNIRTYHLTLATAEKLQQERSAAPATAPAPKEPGIFGRPGEKPQQPKVERLSAEAVVGQPAPGKTPYQYRIEAALKASVNSMDLDFVAPEVRLDVGAATQQTIDNIERATDQQLLQMIDSSQPLGLQAVADVTEVDRFGQPIVKSIKVEVRALDKKTTTALQWMAQRVLASGELRRRAALAALASDVKRSEIKRGAPTTPGGKFGRPRVSYDASTGKERMPDMRRGQPIIDLQDSPGNEAFNLTGTISNTLENQTGEPVNKLQLRDAINRVADVVFTPLLVANMSGKPFVGQYDPRRNLAQVQSTFNFSVNLHEVGHAMVASIFGSGEAGPRNMSDVAPPAVRAELEKLGRNLYGTTVPEGGYLHEGFAEFTAGYVLRPERYNSEYPATAAWYQDQLNSNPELAAAMGHAQDVFSAYRFQGSEARQHAARIDPRDKRGKDPRRSLYRRLRDDFLRDKLEQHFTNSMVKLAQMQGDAIKEVKSQAKRAGRQLNDAELLDLKVADYGEAILAKQQQLLQTWLTTGMTDGNGNLRPGSKSMYHVLAPLRAAAKRIGTENHMRDFETYLAAKRELALMETGRITVATNGIIDMREAIARIEERYGDAIKNTYADYMAWWGNAIQYVKDNDPFLRKVFNTIERVEREHTTTGTYVPLQRVVFDLATGQGQTATLADAFDLQVVEKGARTIASSRVTKGPLAGSASPHFDVLQTAESSLHALLTNVHKRMLTRNVVALGSALNMRGYAIELPVEGEPDIYAGTPQGNDAYSLLSAGERELVSGMRVVGEGSSVNSEGRVIVDLVDVVELPGQVEMDEAGNPVLDMDGNPIPATQIVRKRYSLDENVVKAIATISPHETRRAWVTASLLGKLAKASTGTFKTFATGVNVGFQLISAPIMDFGTTFLNGTQPWCGLRLPFDYIYTMARLAAAETALPGTQYDAYEQYKQLAGGFDTGWGGTQKGATIEALGRSKAQKYKAAAKSIFTPWNGEIYQLLERKLSFASRTGRLLEMQQALKQAGYVGTGPISQEQANAAITAMRRVTTNWSLSGETAGKLNQVMPYFNVTFVTFRDYVRSAKKQMSNPATRVQYAVKTLAVMGTAAAYWAMAHDDDDEAMKEAYANSSYEDRMRYWIFGYKTDDGTTEVVRIPNPMTEFLPAKLVQASLDGMYSNDPYVTGNWMKALLGSFMPSLLPAPAQAGLEAYGNVNDLNKWLLDRGFDLANIPSTPAATPLESSFGKGPAQERITPYTSWAGAKVSEVSGGLVSPRQADQMIESFLAGAPDQLLSLLQIEGPATPTAIKQAPGYGTGVGGLVVSRLVSKTGPFSMRSPKVQELAASLEAAQKRKDSTRVPETPQMAAELMALKDAWGVVSALNHIANYHPTMTREQRQELQRSAVAVATDVTGKVQRGVVYEDYKKWDPMSRALKQERESMENAALAQKPGYYPSIDWSKLLR